MKKIALLYIALVWFGFGYAQIDRTKPPKPAPAPEINIGKAESFTLKNGLKVYLVENHKLPQVAFSLSLRRDQVLEKEKAGYLSATGQLLRRGTTNRTKDQLDEAIDFIGANISTSPTGVFASSLTKHQDQLLELMTDILYNPAFSQEELDKIIKQSKSGLAASKENPDAIAGNVQGALWYGKEHPYGEITTETTLGNVKLEDCKAYYNTYFKPNIAYLAIVGDINIKQAKKLVKKYFDGWEQGQVPSFNYTPAAAPKETFVAMVDRKSSVQSVIRVGYPVELKPGTEDVIKARVMNQIFGGGFSSRLMQNLREDKGFTYGARSTLSNDELVGTFSASASVRNEVTDSAVHEFMYEMTNLVKTGITQKELDAAKASIMGNFARSLESPQTVARFAINTAIFNMDENYYANYLKNLEQITIQDVNAMIEKYMHPDKAYILVVGKAEEVASKLEKFGKVQYYDYNGEPYEPELLSTVPEGVTAETVVASYITALGGKEALESVKDLKTVYEAQVNGMALEITVNKKANTKLAMNINMNGNPMMVQKYNEGEVSVKQMGNPMPVDENTKKTMAAEAVLFKELDLSASGITATLVGQEKIDGELVYSVEYASGEEKSTYYFSAKTNLIVRMSKVAKTPMGESVMNTDYLNYEKKDGIMFPTVVKLPLGPGMTAEAKLKEVKVNSGLSDSLFE